MARRTDRALVSDQAGSRLDPSGFHPSRDELPSARLRRTLPPHVYAALLPSLLDHDYNYEYDKGGSPSAWSSPDYRPYCLSCSTMRRMEHRPYGYQCSVCGAKCEPRDTDGSPKGPDPQGLDGEAATAGAEGIAQKGGDHA